MVQNGTSEQTLLTWKTGGTMSSLVQQAYVEYMGQSQQIMAANNHRLRASSWVVSHETDQCVSNRTSPARIINSVYILYELLLEQHFGPGNCGKKQSKCKTVQDRRSTRTTNNLTTNYESQ